MQAEAAASSACSAPAVVLDRLREEWRAPEARARLREEFRSARPYPHAVLRPFLGEAALRAVRADLTRLAAEEKETDLFRFFQTTSLVPSEQPGAEARPAKRQKTDAKAAGAGPSGSCDAKAAAPGPGEAATVGASLKSLTELFASEDFRRLCADVSGCGELSDRLDLSSQIYPHGGHLLCHDDVIGTRRISFIYYLTDPDEEWTASEGGALELYPPDASGAQPAACPTKEVLPLSDALAFFVVEPGVSFHAVREVRGGRARMSIQGWLHAPSLDAAPRSSTLQQILGSPDVAAARAAASGQGPLTAEDRALLSRWLAPEYLEGELLPAISQSFADASYVLLTSFLRAEIAEEVVGALGEADKADCVGAEGAEPEVPAYSAGAVDGWTLVGPPHLRRYLSYSPAPGAAACHGRLGAGLQRLKEELLSTGAFRRWVSMCTGLEPRSEAGAEVRRFRPGMDYTVAARAGGTPPDAFELDATLMFTASGKEVAEVWAGEEVGGFDSYVEADDQTAETVEAQEVYRGSDDGPLVNLPATCNALALVMRDARTLRFVKYLGGDAPSSRVDISASFAVDPPEGQSSDEEAAGGAAGSSSGSA